MPAYSKYLASSNSKMCFIVAIFCAVLTTKVIDKLMIMSLGARGRKETKQARCRNLLSHAETCLTLTIHL